MVTLNRVFLLGAGASKSYDRSPTGARMPLATDFFQTFHQLDISSNPWVLIEGLIGWLRHERGIPSAFDYLSSGVDIEELHTSVEEQRDRLMASGANYLDRYHSDRAYNELVFLFASVINEIQNGPVSQTHLNLVRTLGSGDAVITFNWDTLLDRALEEATNWRPDTGYGVLPQRVFDDGWKQPLSAPQDAGPRLVKLHGSTNWLTAYPIADPESGNIVLSHDLDPSSFGVFINATRPYDCHAGRYMGPYQRYSFGYYPPNLDFHGRSAPSGRAIISVRPRMPYRPEGTAGSSGLVSMPLIIPPVRRKTYAMFGSLFLDLWLQAEDLLARADEIVVIGYSFPETDTQSIDLFKTAFRRRRDTPRVTILDPKPDRAAEKFRREFGVPSNRLKIFREYFSNETAIDDLFW